MINADDLNIEMTSVDGSQTSQSQSNSNNNSLSNSAEDLEISNLIAKIDDMLHALKSIQAGFSQHMDILNQYGNTSQKITTIKKVVGALWTVGGWGGYGLSYLDKEHDYISKDTQQYVAPVLIGLVPILYITSLTASHLNFSWLKEKFNAPELTKNYTEIRNIVDHDFFSDLFKIYAEKFSDDPKTNRLLEYIELTLTRLVMETNKIAYVDRLYNATKALIPLLEIIKNNISSSQETDEQVQWKNTIKNLPDKKYASFFKPSQELRECRIDIKETEKEESQSLLKK